MEVGLDDWGVGRAGGKGCGVYLLNVESCTHVHEDCVCRGEFAGDVEGGG